MLKKVKEMLIGCLVLTAVAFSACESQEEENKTKPSVYLDRMNQDIHPGDDFFRFVAGKWLDETEIPSAEGQWGSFNELRDYNDSVLLHVLNRAIETNQYDANSDQAKAAKLFEQAMDSLQIERDGTQPLAPYIEEINSISSKSEISPLIAFLHKNGLAGAFGFYVGQDLKDSEVYIANVSQGGIGLPDRDYYTKTDSESRALQANYVDHIAAMLHLLGNEKDDAKAAAKAIMKIETRFAQASMTRTERRNREAQYNKKSITELQKLTPQFDWAVYISAFDINDLDTINVAQPDFFKEFNKMISDISLQDWKHYFEWHLVRSLAPYMSHDFVLENFAFYGTTLSGTEEMRPRWQRMIALVNGSLGEALGRIYVEEVFPPEAKESAKEMVDLILEAFGERIQNLEWMTEETKEKAMEKLSTFKVKIGYPDEWKDYSEIVLEDQFIGSLMNVRRWSKMENIRKLGTEVDPNEWFMTPPTVNAYFSPSKNEIVFPAGILQPPFYDYQADAAVNFGGIGAVIGHEISHGFDDQGRKFDAYGNMNDWWQEKDAEQFEAEADKLAKQFDEFTVFDTLSVNGRMTLGENIADLAGLAVAFDGLQKHLEAEGRPGLIDGFTPEQRFYISWAQVWTIKHRPQTLKQKLVTDVHAPGEFRVLGPLSNLDDFYEAFELTKENKMYRPEEDRVRMW
ncbi:MAG: M13 family metallopeptidase [Cyclobacteriaceae bacterium]|nr:M13 family metallopeptidase [Cyclobacteriaceae bacterium]MCH8515953.1 M13 family metallopeptidase [Cyclobacteriaceae bacterium]